ncbi:ABC transporter G family member 20-like [Oppia nitens]|uniref:ABC transporter G family member 20-like n=1 Tax=Oppia nitens TaxID=1686743 RepID=UPI0023DC40B9|nr:ABC transporter G family member 20-like [Oppia nitens]
MSAICVTNVSYRYKANRVLANIYTGIPEAKIYGLLGPSGAGKTTLLRLILGRVGLQSGSISVLGSPCGQNNRLIGYMPQDCALCLQLSVRQTLKYFANLYHMSDNLFMERLKELDNKIGVPDIDKSIDQLSGGQQRQLSLILALIHKPKLLILDEPTVGTDPELGYKIWQYLQDGCQREMMTVLLVTHYTEEAVNAHSIGFMRDGRLIEEGVPKALLDKYTEQSLEMVFIRLCNRHQINEKHNKIIDDNNRQQQGLQAYYKLDNKCKSIGFNNNNYETNISRKKKCLIDINRHVSMLWILLILIRRNIKQYLHYKLIFIMIFSPAFQTLLMCIIYGVDSVAIKTAIFNGDINSTDSFSTKLFNNIKQIDLYYMKPHTYDTPSLAIDAVRQGRATGAIIVRPNFSDAIEDRVVINTLADGLDNETLADSQLKVYIDNTNYIYSQFMIDSLTQSVWHLISDILVANGRPAIPPPITLVETIYAPDSKLSDYLLPGYMIAFIYLSQVTLSSILLIQERKDGLFDRSIVAGAGHQLIFVSHFLTSSLMSFLNVILMLLIAFIWFDITNYGSYSLVVVLVMTQAVNAISLGLLISSLCRESFVAFFLSLFITLSQLFTSGAVFPNESIEPEVRKLLYYSPISMPTESLRNVMLRGWTFTNFYVYHGFAINLMTALVFIVIAMIVFKRNS